jgi:geranylgeranyl diphosphate synthase, type II
LEKWVNAKSFDREEKIAAVTRLYNEIGIDKMAQAKIAYYFEQRNENLLSDCRVPLFLLQR